MISWAFELIIRMILTKVMSSPAYMQIYGNVLVMCRAWLTWSAFFVEKQICRWRLLTWVQSLLYLHHWWPRICWNFAGSTSSHIVHIALCLPQNANLWRNFVFELIFMSNSASAEVASNYWSTLSTLSVNFRAKLPFGDEYLSLICRSRSVYGETVSRGLNTNICIPIIE